MNNTFLSKFDADAHIFNKIVKHSAGITSNNWSIVNLKTYEWTKQPAGPLGVTMILLQMLGTNLIGKNIYLKVNYC